jgi:hypothetical protein
VGSTHLKKNSQLGCLFPINGKITNVPNHQPDVYIYINPSSNQHDDPTLAAGGKQFLPEIGVDLSHLVVGGMLVCISSQYTSIMDYND